MERYRYRAYVLNEDGSIQLAIDLFCPDDDAAHERAQQLKRDEIRLNRFGIPKSAYI